MSVKIRLARRGRKKLSLFDIIIADSRSPRDGRFIEKIGTYNPNHNPASIVLNSDKALDWLMKGAIPTDTAKAILSYKGVMFKKHLQVGVLKKALSQEEADKRFKKWLDEKEERIQNKISKLSKDLSDKEKAKFEAESKVNQERVEALKKRADEAAKALVAEVKDANAEADPEVEEGASEDSETAQKTAPEAEAVVEKSVETANPEVEKAPSTKGESSDKKEDKKD